MEKEKENILGLKQVFIRFEHILMYLFKVSIFLLLCFIYVYTFLYGFRALALILLLLIFYLIAEERLKTGLCRVKAVNEDFAVFILMLAGWQLSYTFASLIEEGRFFPEAVLVGLCLLALFLVSRYMGKKFEERRREAARLLPEEKWGVLLSCGARPEAKKDVEAGLWGKNLMS